MLTTETLIRLYGCAGWSESSKDTHESIFYLNKDWSDCMDVQADLRLLWAHVRKYILSQQRPIRLNGCKGLSESSLGTHVRSIFSSTKTDQTEWMQRLTWVFFGHTCQKVYFPQQSLWSDWKDAKADLSLHSVHTSEFRAQIFRHPDTLSC